MSTKTKTKAMKKVVRPGKPDLTVALVGVTPPAKRATKRTRKPAKPAPAKLAVITPPPTPALPPPALPPPPPASNWGWIIGTVIAMLAIAALLALFYDRNNKNSTTKATPVCIVQTNTVTATAICDKQKEIIDQLKKQLDDTKKVAELEKAQTTQVVPAPQVPLSAKVVGPAGTAFSFASVEAGITDVNVHISKSGGTSEVTPELEERIVYLQNRIADTKLSLSLMRVNANESSDPGIRIFRREQIRRFEEGLKQMQTELSRLQNQ